MNILKIIGIIIGAILIIYFGSRLQMKAWLKEIDDSFNNKLEDFTTNKNKENDKD